jgi:hypothetical protein
MKQFPIPQIPKQNGVANCKNQTLVGCARSMLQQSKLSKTFWAKAIAITTYIKKNSPIMVMDGTTFKEVWCRNLNLGLATKARDYNGAN